MPVALFIRQSPSLRIEATTPVKKKTYIKSSAVLSNKPFFIFIFFKVFGKPNITPSWCQSSAVQTVTSGLITWVIIFYTSEQFFHISPCMSTNLFWWPWQQQALERERVCTCMYSLSPSILSVPRVQIIVLVSSLTWKVRLSCLWDFLEQSSVSTVPSSRFRYRLFISALLSIHGTGPLERKPEVPAMFTSPVCCPFPLRTICCVQA